MWKYGLERSFVNKAWKNSLKEVKHTTLRVMSSGSAFYRNSQNVKKEDHAEADQN